VRTHLVADVPFGAFLSEGLDSSAVVRYMAKVVTHSVRTFSIGFEEGDYSELEYARRASQRYGTEHHDEIVRPDVLAILPDLVRHYGEPFADSSAIPAYYVSRLARGRVPMVLSGDGGDVALAGYGRYRGWKRFLQPYHPSRSWWKRAVRAVARPLWPSRFPPDGQQPTPSAGLWLGWVQSMGHERRRALWRPEYHPALAERLPAFDEAIAAAGTLEQASLAQYLDYHTYLPGDILTKVDIASMMHSLEVRTPLVDVRVADFAATIPFDVCLRIEPDGSWSGKLPLRQILLRVFEPTFLDRPKTGFRVPLKHWFSRGAQLREVIEERLAPPASRISDFFDPGAIRAMLREHGNDGRDMSQQLWQLLFLEEWSGGRRGCARRACSTGSGARCRPAERDRPTGNIPDPAVEPRPHPHSAGAVFPRVRRVVYRSMQLRTAACIVRGSEPMHADGISLIIPTYNRAEMLSATLQSVKRLNIPSGMNVELLVIDNNCIDDTARVVARAAQDSPIHIRHIVEHQQGLCFGRNRGIAEARYAHLGYLDDDVRVSPDWIHGYFEAVNVHHADAVVGPVFPVFDGERPAFLAGRALDLISSPYSRKGEHIMLLPSRTGHELPGCNFGVRKAVADGLGGFDTSLDRVGNGLVAGGDFEFGRRLVAAGHTTVYSPRCSIEHVMISDKLTRHYLRRRAYGMGLTRRLMQEAALGWRMSLRGLLGAVRLRVQAKLLSLTRQEQLAFELELHALEALGRHWKWSLPSISRLR